MKQKSSSRGFFIWKSYLPGSSLYVDVYSAYVLNGEMNPEYTRDGVHLKDEYKYLWLEILSEYVNK